MVSRVKSRDENESERIEHDIWVLWNSEEASIYGLNYRFGHPVFLSIPESDQMLCNGKSLSCSSRYCRYAEGSLRRISPLRFAVDHKFVSDHGHVLGLTNP